MIEWFITNWHITLVLLTIIYIWWKLRPRKQSRYIPQSVRIKVVEKEGAYCHKLGCGSRKNLEFAHKYPYSLGGENTVENLTLYCRKCNRELGNKIMYD